MSTERKGTKTTMFGQSYQRHSLRYYSAEILIGSIICAIVFVFSLFSLLTRKDKFLTLGDPLKNSQAAENTLAEIEEYVLLGTYPVPVEKAGGTSIDTYYLIGLLDPSDKTYSGFIGVKNPDADTASARDYAVAYQDAFNRKSIETLRIEGTLSALSSESVSHAKALLSQAGVPDSEILKKLLPYEIRTPRQGAKDTSAVDTLFVSTLLSGAGAVVFLFIFLFLHHGIKAGYRFSQDI